MNRSHTAPARRLVADQKPLPQNGLPRYRSIIAVDVEGSTTKLNSTKAHVRKAMYDLFEKALLTAGITNQFCDPLVDRGDGILALLHPLDEIPKTIILDTVVPSLGNLLAVHANQYPDKPLRMRVAIHAGEVHYDGRGCYGEALDLTFRLLDAPIVKNGLKQTDAPLVLVVSDYIYQSIIRHGYMNIDTVAYDTTVTARVAGQRHRGWLRTPDAAIDGPLDGRCDTAENVTTSNCVPLPHTVASGRPRFEPRLA